MNVYMVSRRHLKRMSEIADESRVTKIVGIVKQLRGRTLMKCEWVIEARSKIVYDITYCALQKNQLKIAVLSCKKVKNCLREHI